jgi:hypothetical protein
MRTPTVVPQGIDMNLRTWLQFLRDDVGQMEKSSPFENRKITIVSKKKTTVNNQGNGYVGALPIAYAQTLDVLTVTPREDGGLDIYAEFSGTQQEVTLLLVKR